MNCWQDYVQTQQVHNLDPFVLKQGCLPLEEEEKL